MQSDIYLLEFKCINTRERPSNGGWTVMLTLFTMGIFGGMIALVIYELVEEMRGSKHKLHDRYHE